MTRYSGAIAWVSSAFGASIAGWASCVLLKLFAKHLLIQFFAMSQNLVKDFAALQYIKNMSHPKKVLISSQE
jgi:hypothetical protein